MPKDEFQRRVTPIMAEVDEVLQRRVELLLPTPQEMIDQDLLEPQGGPYAVAHWALMVHIEDLADPDGDGWVLMTAPDRTKTFIAEGLLWEGLNP